MVYTHTHTHTHTHTNTQTYVVVDFVFFSKLWRIVLFVFTVNDCIYYYHRDHTHTHTHTHVLTFTHAHTHTHTHTDAFDWDGPDDFVESSHGFVSYRRLTVLTN